MLNHDEVIALATKIKLAIFDVDGVMTDGTLIIGPDGEEHKHFNVNDGLGLVMLRNSGVMTAVITGRESKAVTERSKQLGIDYVFQGRYDKLAAFSALIDAARIEPQAVCYVGDDLPDIPVMKHVGLSIAVANAHPKLLHYAQYQTIAPGGRGAVREICELILNAQGALDSEIARYESGELRRHLDD